MKIISLLLLLLFSFPSLWAQTTTFILADRYYVSKVLTEAFGPDSQAVIENNILKKGSIFGGPCDIYEQVRSGRETYENNRIQYCFQGKQEFNFPINGRPNLIREALMNKACTELINNNVTFQFFKQQLGKIENFNESLIERITGHFHWDNIKQKSIISGLLEIANKYPDQNKKLQIVIFYSCSDPTWHLI